ncbi:mRNA for protoporphyrinogen oxidase family protein [Salix suchowensis]|nr:mRNA for protoporphyrinogen oxidase family protein [Salix suchowensis]
MTSTFTDLSLLRPTIPSLIPSSFSKFTTYRYFKLCCSLTEGSATFLPFKLNGEAQSSAGYSATADCVIVGGGISGLCIAQALATNHRDVAPNVIVTEARDRVGGNITTLERDGYLWEEGPTVSSLPILCSLWWRLPTPKGQTVGSFRKGLAMLPDAIATRLGSNVKLFWKLSSIIKLENGGLVSLLSKIVVFTVPSHTASTLLHPLSLISFPDRAPSGRILLLNYVGGATNSGIVCKTESELVEAVDCDLRKMLINPKATDPLVLEARVWPQAIPQFLSGHFDIPDAARDASEVTDYKYC